MCDLICPPDAYQHEPNAPAHRHDERCRRAEQDLRDRITELEAANSALAQALDLERQWTIMAQARIEGALARAKEAKC